MASKASMSGRPALSFCFTWMGYQRSFRPSSPACCLRGAALDPTGKMRPSTPMSPTCTLFGMPPRAMTAQFSVQFVMLKLLPPRGKVHDCCERFLMQFHLGKCDFPTESRKLLASLCLPPPADHKHLTSASNFALPGIYSTHRISA